MEYDRYQQNHKLFIIGMICLLAGLALSIFILYITPALLLGWVYQIPVFILDWQYRLNLDYQWTEKGAAWLIILGFLGLTLFFFYIAYYSSNHIDNEIYHIRPHEDEDPEVVREDRIVSSRITWKIIGLIVLVLIGIYIMQWLIDFTT